MGVLYFTTIGSVVSDTAAIDAVWDLTTDGVVASWLDPPQPIQPGGAIGPDIVDSRPTDALWQNDRLVFVSTYPCGTGPRDCVRVTELDTDRLIDDLDPRGPRTSLSPSPARTSSWAGSG